MSGDHAWGKITSNGHYDVDFLDWQEKGELKIYRILSLFYRHESSMYLNPLKIIKWLGKHAAFGYIVSPIAHH